MATIKTHGFKTAVHKPVDDVTDATSITYKVNQTKTISDHSFLEGTAPRGQRITEKNN